MVTRIAIVGGGRAATLHAEAVRAVPGLALVGIGGRTKGSAAELAAALDTVDMALERMVEIADGLVVAVPAAAQTSVLSRLPAELPVLVEGAVELHPTDLHPTDLHPTTELTGMTAVNLLHAPVVSKALTALREMGEVHHLELRSRSLRPTWGHFTDSPPAAGVLSHPGAGLLPVLLAAAGAAVDTVAAQLQRDEQGQIVEAALTLGLGEGRIVRIQLGWTDRATDAEAELEAASARGVMQLRLWPALALELDGRAITIRNEPPLVALGFAAQMQRFAAVCRGESVAWPPLTTARAVASVVQAALRSDDADGVPVTP